MSCSTFQIFVKSPVDGKTKSIDVDCNDRVEDLKLKIEDREGVPCSEQRLVFGGKQLENGRTLLECKIRRESTVHLSLRLRGGGVPAFFRWIMLKYKKCIVSAIEEKPLLVNGEEIPVDTSAENPNGMEFDNLYLDMNGIVHNCSHGEDLGRRPDTEAEMFDNICKYIDRLVRVARPRKLLYMAIDGVAPRAKMNQQRSRRFRAAQERDELAAIENQLRERFRRCGKAPPPRKKPSWDHNVITPGTEFMTKLSSHLQWYCHDRITNDPSFRNLRVILSDARCPGEGEHKIMQFIRQQRAQPGYQPNERHILHGLDADLIMLGLATHEAHFTIFREQVFTPKGKEEQKVADNMLFDKPLEFLHIHILREYLKAEFIDLKDKIVPPSDEALAAMKKTGQEIFVYDFERIVDDFVFLCFFVGNDFLPHLPSLDIREGALGVLMSIYRAKLPAMGGYLTNCGDVNLGRVDIIVSVIGSFEEETYLRRQREAERIARQSEQVCRAFQRGNCDRGARCRFKHVARELCRNFQRGHCRNGDNCRYEHKSKEQLAIEKTTQSKGKKRKFNEKEEKEMAKLVLENEKKLISESENKDAALALKKSITSKDENSSLKGGEDKIEKEKNEGEIEDEKGVKDDFEAELKELVYNNNVDSNVKDDVKFGQAGWKQRYYLSKFGPKAKDPKFIEEIVSHFTHGLCWVLAYYYKGCVSWKWYYPYHYAPCASDLINLDRFKISFELSKPFSPIAQLMGVQPASSKHMLPKPCWDLMESEDSPIIDFYPKEFDLDPNGHKYKWLWVVLLPFIDEKRLFVAMQPVVAQFTAAEKFRNTRGEDLLYIRYDNPLAAAVLAAAEESKAGRTKSGQVYVQRIDGADIDGLIEVCENAAKKGETAPSPIGSGSGDDRFKAVKSNQALVLTYKEPPLPYSKRPHKCEILEGAVFPEEILLPQDKVIKEPRLGRGVSIADLGVKVLDTNTKYGHNDSNSGNSNVPIMSHAFFQNRPPRQSYSAPPKSWGSAEPRAIKKQRRNDYSMRSMQEQLYGTLRQHHSGRENNYYQDQSIPVRHRGGGGGYVHQQYNPPPYGGTGNQYYSQPRPPNYPPSSYNRPPPYAGGNQYYPQQYRYSHQTQPPPQYQQQQQQYPYGGAYRHSAPPPQQPRRRYP
eukprot:g5647.t1